MKQGVIYSLIALMFVAVSLADFDKVSAQTTGDVKEEIEEYEQEQENLEDEKSDLKSDKNNTEQEIKENKEKQNTVTSEIETIDQELAEKRESIASKQNEIDETNDQLDQLNQQIDELNKEIDKLEEEISQMKERIEKREALLKDRLRAIQSNGGSQNYIEVIMGSQSFGDFISRSTAVNTIMDQDQSIMETHLQEKKEMEAKKAEVEANKEEIEQKKSEIKAKKASLEDQKQELESLKAQLDDKMAKKESLLGELEEEEQKLEEHKVSLEDEQEILRKQEAANQRAIEAAKAEKAKLEQKSQSSNNTNSASSAPTNASSDFIKPVSTYVSSEYGQRWGRLHAGLDFGGVGTGTPVKSAASGVVFLTSRENDGSMSGYGNMMLIRHSINGVTYTTLYAHLNSLSVSEGQMVNQGQVVGTTGSTGGNFAAHLHFEIHQPEWTNSKKHSVNPRNYLN